MIARNAAVLPQTVSAGLAQGLVDFARTKGVDADALTRSAGLRPEQLKDRDDRVTISDYRLLTRSAIRLSGDPSLPLRYGLSIDMGQFSVVGLLFQSCESLRDAIEQINRYGKLVVQVDLQEGERFRFVERFGGLWLEDTRSDPDSFPELTEATFARFIGMTRQFWETPLVDAIHVAHPAPAHAEAYERLLRAPTHFCAGWNAMRVDGSRLAAPIARQPRYVFAILGAHAEKLLRKLETATTFRAIVETLLLRTLHTGGSGASHLANRLGISRQTLYRRLRAEGVTYERVLDELRHQVASSYLEAGKVSINEIAYLVGFSDRTAFAHAFKRWTGRGPRAYASHPQA